MALTNLPNLPGQFLCKFHDFGVLGGSFWAPGWMPEATSKDHVSSNAKCRENVAKIGAWERLWDHVGALKGLLGRLGHSLHIIWSAVHGLCINSWGKNEIL